MLVSKAHYKILNCLDSPCTADLMNIIHLTLLTSAEGPPGQHEGTMMAYIAEQVSMLVDTPPA